MMNINNQKEEIVEVIKSKTSKRMRQASIEPTSQSNMSLPKMKMGRIANMIDTSEGVLTSVPDREASLGKH